jgi:hypothetical protein
LLSWIENVPFDVRVRGLVVVADAGGAAKPKPATIAATPISALPHLILSAPKSVLTVRDRRAPTPDEPGPTAASWRMAIPVYPERGPLA